MFLKLFLIAFPIILALNLLALWLTGGGPIFFIIVCLNVLLVYPLRYLIRKLGKKSDG